MSSSVGRNTSVSPRCSMACWPSVLTVIVFGASGFVEPPAADGELLSPAHALASSPETTIPPSILGLLMREPPSCGRSGMWSIRSTWWLEGNTDHVVPRISQTRGECRGRPVDMSDVLLISGLPGAGKTQYTDWLSGQGWGYLRSDESADHPALLAAIFNDDDGPLRAAADGYPTGFVVEWGLPVGCLPQLKAMLRRADYDAWYFNGNPDAAFAAWQQRKDRTPDDESNCHRQFADLEASFETRRPSAPADRCRPGVVRRRRNSTQDSVRSRIASGLTFPKSRASVPALRPRRTRR